MQQIDATLPTLGSVAINFYEESDQVLRFFGARELERLGRIPHLGVASSVFTGVQHSRQEYTLLQCAIVELVARLHAHTEQLAVSNKVHIDGLSNPVSSGEVLLKCWSLLGNFGHAKQTFGTERGILNHARKDKRVRSWIRAALPEDDLKIWADRLIDRYHYEHVHYLLTLVRTKIMNPRDPRKHLIRQLVRNRVLPTDELLSEADSSEHYKLRRVRGLFDRIRLLAMVTLDAHYSHSPFEVQLHSAVNSLAGIMSGVREASRFDAFLRQMASQLADELYMHERACAVMRAYEEKVGRRIPKRFRKATRSSTRARHFVSQVMADGFGEPEPNSLHPLFRLSFGEEEMLYTPKQDRFEARDRLEQQVGTPQGVLVNVDRNPFSADTHIDFVYRPEVADANTLAALIQNIRTWLLRLVQARVQNQLRPLRRAVEEVEHTNGDIGEEMKELYHRVIGGRLERQLVLGAQDVYDELFFGTMTFLMPEGWNVQIREHDREASGTSSVRFKVKTRTGTWYDNVSDKMVSVINRMENAGATDRVQELEALQRVLRYRSAPMILSVYNPVVITNQFDMDEDEWDGVVLAVDDDHVRLHVVEAKNYSSGKRNEDRAFRQLRDSIDLVTREHTIKYRRRRLADLGAQAIFYLDEEK